MIKCTLQRDIMSLWLIACRFLAISRLMCSISATCLFYTPLHIISKIRLSVLNPSSPVYICLVRSIYLSEPQTWTNITTASTGLFHISSIWHLLTITPLLLFISTHMPIIYIEALHLAVFLSFMLSDYWLCTAFTRVISAIFNLCHIHITINTPHIGLNN